MAGHFRGAFHPPTDTVPVTNGAGGGLPPVPKAFLEPQVSGFMRPVRFEGEINNLEIIGDIPKEIDGTFYRVMPEPQFPAFIPNDPVSVVSSKFSTPLFDPPKKWDGLGEHPGRERA